MAQIGKREERELTDPVVCLPDQDDPCYWSKRRSADECKHGGPGSTMNFWAKSSYIDQLTLGVKMRSTAAFLSMPDKSGVVTGGKSIRGFNDNTVRGYSLWLPLSTDVVQFDEDILRPKGGRHVKDESDEIEDLEKRREVVRQVCALRYLDGYPNTKVIDPIKENFPACTMPLSCTTPACITPAILRNRVYVAEYLVHVALIRELLDQFSLSTNPQLLSASNNRLLQSLSGLLTNTSDITLTREPIPVWNLVRVIRLRDSAEAVQQMTRTMDGKDDMSINMPCAPVPVSTGEAAEFMHPRLVAYLKGYQSYK